MGRKSLVAAAAATETPQYQQVPFLVATFHFAGQLSVKTGTAKFIVPAGTWTITDVKAVITTANTGATVIADVNKNGTTIFGTQGNRPTIPVSTTTAVTSGAFSVSSLSGGDLLSVDVDQIGSTIAGSHLTVMVAMTRQT